MNGCNHTRYETVEDEDWETGEPVSRQVEVSAFVDLSLHSYKCTLCGEVGWYSQRGRIAETRGISVHDVTAEMIAEDDAK